MFNLRIEVGNSIINLFNRVVTVTRVLSPNLSTISNSSFNINEVSMMKKFDKEFKSILNREFINFNEIGNRRLRRGNTTDKPNKRKAIMTSSREFTRRANTRDIAIEMKF